MRLRITNKSTAYVEWLISAFDCIKCITKVNSLFSKQHLNVADGSSFTVNNFIMLNYTRAV